MWKKWKGVKIGAAKPPASKSYHNTNKLIIIFFHTRNKHCFGTKLDTMQKVEHPIINDTEADRNAHMSILEYNRHVWQKSKESV